ncbi:MAG: Fic family protein [Alphaproteobacteria bacterium]|nr:Fic family protein [Alphaproteobacteria bacterium]
MSALDPYVYPDAPGVLKNKFGLKDAAELDAAERVHVAQRIRQGSPSGNFDLGHLKAIHRHLFQDVYTWAGETRTVEIAKDGDQFHLMAYIEAGMADIHGRLVQRKFLKGLSAEAFARVSAEIVGDLNYVHPFREGNGRTQLQYLKQLAQRAGHDIDLTRLQGKRWIAASRAAQLTNYEPMRQAIAAALKR